MSSSTTGLPATTVARGRPEAPIATRARVYFASDTRRALQTVLGLIWLLDGGLQFQSFMYSKGFIQMLEGLAPGQPGWVASSVTWGAHVAQRDLGLYNTLFALTQVAIGLALLYRPAVKPALAVSFAWVLVVWWFGEAFGMMFMTMASPLTGAPGAVLLYGIVGLIVWPNGRPGGLLGVRGTRAVWVGLWLVMAWLWLEEPSSSANAITGAINAAPSGMSWLSTVQDWAADAAKGNGLPIALLFALASVAIAIAVAVDWHVKEFIGLAIVIALVYWVFGEGFGGIVQGGATDPNSGPLWIVLALAVYSTVTEDERPAAGTAARRAPVPAAASDEASRLAVFARSRGARPAAPRRTPWPRAWPLAPVALAAVVLAGCAPADKPTPAPSASPVGSGVAAGTSGMDMSSSSGSSGAAASGMDMSPGAATTNGVAVDGIKPIPTQLLASTSWQGMSITARAMTPVPFVVYNGTSEQMVRPGPKTSFHLMVMLNDAHTGVAIPYAGVWATITRDGRLVYDERQWPMLSEYMGPHYGNNVSLPGPGRYELTLLISPPVSARHIEYEHVWLQPHRATLTFNWKPPS